MGRGRRGESTSARPLLCWGRVAKGLAARLPPGTSLLRKTISVQQVGRSCPRAGLAVPATATTNTGPVPPHVTLACCPHTHLPSGLSTGAETGAAWCRISSPGCALVCRLAAPAVETRASRCHLGLCRSECGQGPRRRRGVVERTPSMAFPGGTGRADHAHVKRVITTHLECKPETLQCMSSHQIQGKRSE